MSDKDIETIIGHRSKNQLHLDYVNFTTESIQSTVSSAIPEINHAELICQKLTDYGDRIVLVDATSGREWTGYEMKCSILKLSFQLVQKYGLKRGERVSFHCRNSDYHAIALFAVLAAGGVYTGCGHLHPYREVFNTVGGANATVLVAEKENVQLVEQARGDLPKPDVRLVLTILSDVEGYDSIEDLLNGFSEIGYNFAPIQSINELAVIHFSSGTTGNPKPVIRTHGNFNSIVLLDQRPGHWFPGSENDVVGCGSPFVHGGGMSLLLLSLGLGSKAVVISGYTSASKFCRYVQTYRLTSVMLVPSQVLFLNRFDELDKYDVSSLNDVLITGSKIEPNVSRALIHKYQVAQYRLLYGSTEMFWVSLIPKPVMLADSQELDLLSVGLPMPGIEIKIIDPQTGQCLGAEQSGEIVVKGPQVTPGYLNCPRTTESCFTKDGFYRTGDCGHFESNGRLFVGDRFTEMIKSEGIVVSPTELEAILRFHPAIAEVTVIGEPHELYGEAPRAYVVKTKGVEVTEDEIVQYLDVQVASWKRLRNGVKFVQQMPRTAFGKIDKQALRRSTA